MTADLRRLAEQAIEREPPWELIGEELAPSAREWWNAANPQAILALLDERDHLTDAYRSTVEELSRRTRRVAALDQWLHEKIAYLEALQEQGNLTEHGHGSLQALQEARALLASPNEPPDHRPAIGLSSAGRHTLCMGCGEPWPCRSAALPAEVGE